MKCDKLNEKIQITNDTRMVYLKSEVDAAIAELKEIANDACLERDDNQKVIDELEAENQRLVKCCKEYDSRQRIDERIKANASKQLRATKRALWLARAERAKETQFLWQVYCHCDKLYFCKPFCVSTRKNPYRYISHMNVVEWDEFWGKIKNKCLAKAEEYK